jgi:hypothetical protein
MVEQSKRPYEPPLARDLSGFSVSGQIGPQGWCQNGWDPIVGECATGGTPEQWCDPGGALGGPNPCNPTGLIPTAGRCSTGQGAVEGCVVGSSLT